MLERGEPRYGALVRSIRFEIADEQQKLELLEAVSDSFSTLPTTAATSDRFWEGIAVAMERCYRQLSNLQSLVILSPYVSFFHHFFYHKTGEQLKPLSFLGGSLKRLYIDLWDSGSFDINFNLNARNATWILVFCRQIEEASLGFQMSVEDSRYLSEFAETFAGLSSVKKLAIRVHFTYKAEEKKTWWVLVV
jgi:hypothetical protein